MSLISDVHKSTGKKYDGKDQIHALNKKRRDATPSFVKRKEIEFE